jgi:hypothetical protein
MGDEVLKVVGSADMSSLTRGLTDAQRGLSQTANEALKTDRAFSRLGGAGVKDAASGLTGLGGAVSRTTDNLKGSVKGSSQASNALLNLGRVAQDAPFGFIGIANNLNPLLESFQRLQQTTGGAGNALKALGASLLGPAGIGIALSVVSSLFIAFGSQISDFINSVSDAEKSQRTLNKALGEAESSVAGQVSRLKALVSIAQDVNNSDANRKEAIGALNKEYDVFNKQLNLSNINTSFATDLIDKQTQALIRQAKIRGLENLISKTTEKRFDIQNRKLEENLSLWNQIKIAVLSGGSLTSASTNSVIKGLEKRSEALGKNAEETSFYEDELKKLLDADAEAGTLFKEKSKAAKKGKDLLTIAEVLKALRLELDLLNAKEINLKTDETNDKIRAIEKAIDDLITKVGVKSNSKLVLDLFAQINDIRFSKFKVKFKPQEGDFDVDLSTFDELLSEKIGREALSKNGSFVLPIPVQPKLEFIKGLPSTLNEIDELKKIAYLKSVGVTTGIQDGLKVGVEGLRFPQLTALYDSTIATVDTYTAKIKEFSINAFTSLGEVIGNSLSSLFSGDKIGNVFGNLFGTILKSLGEGLKQLGIQAIAASKLIIAIKATLGKPAGIIGGIALVALGTLISGIANRIQAPKFATGTRNFTGGTALVGERGPELLSLPRGASVTPNSQSNSILNGAANSGFVASYVLRGQDLVTVISRTNQSNNRMGFN